MDLFCGLLTKAVRTESRYIHVLHVFYEDTLCMCVQASAIIYM